MEVWFSLVLWQATKFLQVSLVYFCHCEYPIFQSWSLKNLASLLSLMTQQNVGLPSLRGVLCHQKNILSIINQHPSPNQKPDLRPETWFRWLYVYKILLLCEWRHHICVQKYLCMMCYLVLPVISFWLLCFEMASFTSLMGDCSCSNPDTWVWLILVCSMLCDLVSNCNLVVFSY